MDGSRINVTVKDGIVILSGEVTSFLERKAAFEDAWSVPGVLSVENQIKVATPAGMPTRSDGEIRANIESLLEWNPTLNASQIKVSVDASNVILEGVVVMDLPRDTEAQYRLKDTDEVERFLKKLIHAFPRSWAGSGCRFTIAGTT